MSSRTVQEPLLNLCTYLCNQVLFNIPHIFFYILLHICYTSSLQSHKKPYLVTLVWFLGFFFFACLFVSLFHLSYFMSILTKGDFLHCVYLPSQFFFLSFLLVYFACTHPPGLQSFPGVHVIALSSGFSLTLPPVLLPDMLPSPTVETVQRPSDTGGCRL